MPLYIAEYLADTAHLDAAESGAYLHLIMHYWQKGGLPTGDAQLARISKMTEQSFSNSKALLSEFFSIDEAGKWQHNRIDAELSEANTKHARRVAAGQKGGRPSLSNGKAMLKDSPPTTTTTTTVKKEDASHPMRERANGMAEAFDRFWEAYPEKVGKKPAALAFAKVASEVELIIEGLARYVQNKPADRQWLNPATFLNQRRWEDKPAPQPIGGQNHVRSNNSVSVALRDIRESGGAFAFGPRPDQQSSGSGVAGGGNVRLLPEG